MAAVTRRSHSQGREYTHHINGSDSDQYQASDYQAQSLTCQYCEHVETSKAALNEHSVACAKKTDECPRCRNFVARAAFVHHYQNNCEEPKETNPLTPKPPPTPRERSSFRRDARSASKESVVDDTVSPSSSARPVAPERRGRNSIILIPCQFCHESVELPIWAKHIQDCREKENQRETRPARSSRRSSISAQEVPQERPGSGKTVNSNKLMSTPRSKSAHRPNSAPSLDSSHRMNSGHITPTPRLKRSSSHVISRNSQNIEQMKPHGKSPIPAPRSPSPRLPRSNDPKSKSATSSKNTFTHNLTNEQASRRPPSRTQSLTRTSRPSSPGQPPRPRTSSISSERRSSVSSSNGHGRGGSNPSQSNASKPLATPNAFQNPNVDPKQPNPKIMGRTPSATDKKKLDRKNALPSRPK